MITERAWQAHRLHQFRVEARLTTQDIDERMGWPKGRCHNIEYSGAGRVQEIKQAIAQFEPGKRRLRAR